MWKTIGCKQKNEGEENMKERADGSAKRPGIFLDICRLGQMVDLDSITRFIPDSVLVMFHEALEKIDGK